MWILACFLASGRMVWKRCGHVSACCLMLSPSCLMSFFVLQTLANPVSQQLHSCKFHITDLPVPFRLFSSLFHREQQWACRWRSIRQIWSSRHLVPLVLGTLFLVDMMLSFHGGWVVHYNLQMKIVMDGWQIARFYVWRGGFWLDLPAGISVVSEVTWKWAEIYRAQVLLSCHVHFSDAPTEHLRQIGILRNEWALPIDLLHSVACGCNNM